MHITKKELKELIREAVVKQLFEASDDPKAAYERFLELKKRHTSDLWVLKKVGPEQYDEILDLKDIAEDYNDFFNLVGPGLYDRSKGRSVPNNKFGMRPEMVHGFWNGKFGTVRAKELEILKDELDELEARFKTVKASSPEDARYGRRRTNVVDTHTGKVVGSSADRKGSLGS